MNPRLLLLPVTVLLTGCPGNNDSASGPGKSGGMPPVPVNVATAVKKDVPFEVRTFGNVEPIASVAIKAQVGGDLIGVHFKEGDEVEAKKLLFTIQPRLYETQRAQAQANLDRDRATAANAALALKRQEALDAKGSGIKEELERARTLAESTAATVRADEALLLIAQTQEGYTTIEAPMAGRTGSIRLREGNLIRVSDELPLTTIVQMAPVYITFALPELHLDAIRRGMAAPDNKLVVTARDAKDSRTLGEGHVTFIANTVDTATGTIMLKATFDNKDRALWPGAFVDVSLRLSTDKDAVVVPSSAVTVSQRGPQVFVVKEDGAAEARAVTVSRTAGQESIIKEGVAAGETVISNGQSRVLPGAKVVPNPAASQPARGDPASPGTGSEKPAGPASPVPAQKVSLRNDHCPGKQQPRSGYPMNSPGSPRERGLPGVGETGNFNRSAVVQWREDTEPALDYPIRGRICVASTPGVLLACSHHPRLFMGEPRRGSEILLRNASRPHVNTNHAEEAPA